MTVELDLTCIFISLNYYNFLAYWMHVGQTEL